MAQPIKATPIHPEGARVRAGWEKRTTLDEPRLSEVVAMYQKLGFEVRQEPFEPGGESGCSDCLKADQHRCRTVYTRRR